VVTNKSMRFTDPLTRAMPLFASAGAVVCGDTTPHAKPHPEPLFEAARRLGVPPERACMSATTNATSSRADAAGMRTVAATYGYLGQKAEPAHWGERQHRHAIGPDAFAGLLKSP
jgi:beta-phosphoglucomutase-like phosphatase (HAD superfamily)